ncbi:MAG TPA: hypothetical protein VK139_02210, partial [Microbacteriaceae bacterium]|nr:hypothetical protein [Microbacteriaceae bacterium]
IGVAAQVSARNVGRIAPRFSVSAGLAISGAGFFWLHNVMTLDADYLTILVPLLLASFGIGLTFVPLTLTAISNVEGGDAGVASGTLNTSQQVGGSIGLAVLVTVATTAITDRITELMTAAAMSGTPMMKPSPAVILEASVFGWASAFQAAALICFAGALLVLVLITRKVHAGEAQPTVAH